ncbi:MAG: cytidylate kinase-like family protein [Deltaproteobacteria bacterium]|nr:MAG: cytidylate kinase-like family protein [Deltaproteobacteria bacterium]
MAVITINKECGTESEKVATLLAKKLGWEYIGDQLVAKIAKELHISKSEVEAFRRDAQSRILRFVDRYTCSLIQKVVDRERGCLDDSSYFDATKGLVEKIYEEKQAIILGWGGQCLLRGKPDVLHVRLTKDEEGKIETIMKRFKIDRKAAQDYIHREEGDAKSLIKHYFNEDWKDANLYDLIVDVGKTSIEDGVDTIIVNLKQKTGYAAG